MKKDVVIIGAGLGGLFIGAILAKEGFNVTLLEQNATIGGGLQSFTRFGEIFDTGMHIIGGLSPDGNIRKVCEYLGIADRIEVMDVDEDCTDMLYFSEDKCSYRIAKGKEGFVSSLATYFPHEREHLEKYVEAIFEMADQVDLFNLKPSTGALSLYTQSRDFISATNDFIAKYIEDEKLRSIVAYMNPLYGGRADQTPAYIHAIISVLYLKGACRFVGGSSHFADLLAEVITNHGGRVLTNEKVDWIEVKDRKVEYVKSVHDNYYKGDIYVSAIHPCTMLNLMNEDAYPKSYKNRLHSIPNSYSAFSLFIKLKPDTFPYINHSEYYMTKYSDVWHFDDTSKAWPLGFLFMTPPEKNQGEYSNKAIIMAPMPFDFVTEWQDTTVGRRGESYKKWKEEHAEALLNHVEEMHPGFRDCILDINSASPLTIRDFYGVKDGSISGYSKDCNNIALSQVPVVTKVSNLLLTGQNNNLHGFCGVPLTAVDTCEAILGKNYIINKINACVNS